MAKFVALYLPQYHPIPENDGWYGKGFTEWTNVAKAKPLFRGHYEPHIPADLGFYDLRLIEVRRAQAEMAQEYGIAAFCYWNYWFGAKKQLLQMPIWEVYKDKSISLPFCLAWANHSWERKLWDDKGTKEMLMEQKYLGEKDYTDYFYTMLPLFKDERYFRVNGKLFYMLWDPLACDEIGIYITCWRKLAREEKIDDFYFVGRDSDCRNKEKILSLGFDAVYDDNALNIHHKMSKFRKVLLFIKRKFLGMPTVIDYKKAIKYMITDNSSQLNVIPAIAPNFDHSSRSGRKAFILHNCEPEYFGQVVKMAAEAVEKKPENQQVVLIKSWNEWGEGNHLEPDLKYGRGYLEAIRKVLDDEE